MVFLGRWSAPIPACMNIVCPENITALAKNNLRVHVHSFAAGQYIIYKRYTPFQWSPTGNITAPFCITFALNTAHSLTFNCFTLW